MSRRSNTQGLIVDLQAFWDQLDAIAHHLADLRRARAPRARRSRHQCGRNAVPVLGTATPARSGACTRRRFRAIGSCRANPRRKAARVGRKSGPR
jgi:hypothetical protein